MKRILSKLMDIESDLKPIDFGKILTEREVLCILFPDNLETSYQLFCYLAGWKHLFRKFLFHFSDNLLAFFSHLSFSEQAEFLCIRDFVPTEKALIFNFLAECNFQEDIAASEESIIVDMNQVHNIKMIPNPKTEMQLLESFARLFHFPLQKEKLEIKALKDESSFYENKALNIILDIGEPKHAKYYDSIIKMMKNECNANIYLTGISFEQDDFAHVKNMKLNDVMQLFTLAANSDLFLTDDFSLLIVLKKFLPKVIFLGKEGTFEDMRCLQPKNIFELKNVVQEMTAKKDW